MRRASAVVGLCLLLALAGCSSLPGFSDEQAPGVEDDELVDAEALLDAHASELAESGFSHDMAVNQTVDAEDGTTENSRRQRTSVAAEGSQYLRQELLFGGQGRIIAWGNDSVEYIRVDSGGSTSYQRGQPDDVRTLTGVKVLKPFLSAPFEVVDTDEVEGRTVYKLESTGQPDDENAFPNNTTSVDRFDAELIVDEDGRIHRLRATADYAIDGDPGSYELAYELTSEEDPGVERPDWVDDIVGSE